MPKPIAQINAEYQAGFNKGGGPVPYSRQGQLDGKSALLGAEFTHSASLPRSLGPGGRRMDAISFADTSPNGSLPAQIAASYAKAEYSPRRESEDNTAQDRGAKRSYRRKREREAKKRAFIRKLVNGVAGVLIFLSLFIYLLSALIYINLRYGPQTIFSYYIMPQMPDSAVPETHNSPLLFVQSADPSELNIGDTVVYRRNPAFFIAREVIAISHNTGDSVESEFLIRGLNEEAAASSYVKLSQITGRVVFSVPAVGGIMLSIANNLLVVGMVFFYLIFRICSLKKLFTTDYGSTARINRDKWRG